jgi:hypothetical protein
VEDALLLVDALLLEHALLLEDALRLVLVVLKKLVHVDVREDLNEVRKEVSPPC